MEGRFPTARSSQRRRSQGRNEAVHLPVFSLSRFSLGAKTVRKQKAKRSVEKAFLTFSLPQNQGSSPVGSVSRAAEFRQVKEARIKFVRENDLFHHGNVRMPDPSTDPSVRAQNLPGHVV